MDPAPRDFRRGIVKYASVPSGQLPTDADLARTIRHGLAGTPMRAWDLPDDDVDAIVQYLKTFSPRWRTERAGTPIAIPPDPWLARDGEARERGARVYHAVAQCWTCHPAYASRAQMVSYVFELQGMHIEESDIRPNVEFGVMQTTDWGTYVMPPDFPQVEMKAGNSLQDLYRTITAGVGGTSMPAWQGVLPDEDLWALVHYVRSLARQ
jgi:mono/diheme cytochrome c family protein